MIKFSFTSTLITIALCAISAGADTSSTMTKNSVTMIEGHFVYLSSGTGANIAVDQFYRTYRELSVTIDKSKGFIKKETVETALLRIVEVNAGFSKAKIIKNKGIALGDFAQKVEDNARFGIIIGYSMFSVGGKVNKSPSAIPGVGIPDFSSFDLPAFMYGGFLGVDLLAIPGTKLGTKFNFNLFPSCGDLEGFSMDLSVYRKFTLPDSRFMIPVGLGVSVSMVRYKYHYALSMVYRPDEHVRQYLGGAVVYSGLDFAVNHFFHTFVNIGFRYQEANKGWAVRYETGEKKFFWGYHVKDNYEIPSQYHAVNDFRILGLDLKAGIAFVF